MKNPQTWIKYLLIPLLIISFILLVGSAFFELLRGSSFLFVIFLFGLTGLFMLIFVLRKSIKPKKFLLLTASSALGFMFFAVLHNLFYAIAVSSGNGSGVSVLNFFGAVFFFLAVVVCPATFFIGLLGSLLYFIREKRN